MYFRIYGDFEADNESDISSKGNKTTIFFQKIPVCNGYYIVSELDDVLKYWYCESHLGYDNKNWFVDEVIK